MAAAGVLTGNFVMALLQGWPQLTQIVEQQGHGQELGVVPDHPLVWRH